MGVQTDVVMADRGDAQAVADADSPAAEWPGFTFKGFDNVKLCTLLSLLRVGSPDAEFSRYLDLIAPASEPAEDGPVVFAVPPAEVTELAAVAALAEAQFKALAVTWAATEEFAGWSGSE